MTGYRRALGRSRVPRRYVSWSEKAFYLEQSKKKIQIDGTKGSSSATRNSFCQEHPQSSKRRFWRWHALQQYPRSPMGPAAWNRERDGEQSAVGHQSGRSSSTSSTADNRGAAAKKSLHQASSGIGEVRVDGPVYCAPEKYLGINSPRPEKSNSNHVNNRKHGQILNFRRKMEE